MHVEIFGSFCVIFKEKSTFKYCKISGWQKRWWAHTFFVKFRIFKPVLHKLSIQYIRFIFIGRVNHAMTFQYSEPIVLSSIGNCIAYANIVNKDSPIRSIIGFRGYIRLSLSYLRHQNVPQEVNKFTEGQNTASEKQAHVATKLTWKKGHLMLH